MSANGKRLPALGKFELGKCALAETDSWEAQADMAERVFRAQTEVFERHGIIDKEEADYRREISNEETGEKEEDPAITNIARSQEGKDYV